MSPNFRLMHKPRLPGFRALASIGLLAGVTTLSGCKLDTLSGSNSPQGLVQFINAAPRYGTVNLLVDNGPVLASPQPFQNGTSVYLNALAAPRTFRITAGADTTTLASSQLLVENMNVYTMIVTQHPVGAGLVILPDTVSPPATGHVALRVINASTSAGAVDVYVTGVDSTLTTPAVSGVAFEGNSGYIIAPLGTIRLRITAAGTKNVLLDIDASSLVDGQARSVLVMDSAAGGLPVVYLPIPDRG